MQMKKGYKFLACNPLYFSGPRGIRIPNLLIRSQMLYPIKLWILFSRVQMYMFWLILQNYPESIFGLWLFFCCLTFLVCFLRNLSLFWHIRWFGALCAVVAYPLRLMKVTQKGLLYALVIVVVAVIILWPRISRSLFPESPGVGPEPSPRGSAALREPLQVEAVVITPQNLTDVVRSVGTLLPEEEVDLTFESSGKITEILFEEGEMVKKGDVLAHINDRPLQAQWQKLQAQQKLALLREFRQKALLEKEAVSQESYDQVATELEAIEADMALVQARLYETVLRAPFDGTIGLRLVSEGHYVTPSTKIAKLTKISSLKIDFAVSERYSRIIGKGTRLSFTLDGDLNEYNAEVYAVDSRVEETMRTMMVRALFPNKNTQLFPGRFASIRIVLNQLNDVVAIPSQAIIPELGKEIVFVYRSGKAESRDISIGLRTESQVEVKDGLSFGDTLLTSGILQLRQNLPVVISRINQTNL